MEKKKERDGKLDKQPPEIYVLLSQLANEFDKLEYAGVPMR